MNIKKQFDHGFSIVELIVVIVIIGILAAITIVSYTGMQNRATVTSLKSDLNNAADLLRIDQVHSSTGVFPATLAVADGGSGIPASKNTTYQYTVNNTNTPKTFCLTATKNAQSYNINQEGIPFAGPCPVLWLDAGITTSYSGSGTTWTDLSGNGNNATMYGTVPFGTDTVPNFNFATVTGANSAAASLGFTFASNMITRTGDFTLSSWVKNPPTSASGVGLFSNAGSGDGYRYGVGLNGIYYLIGPTYQEATVTYLAGMQSTTWNYVVVVYGRSTATISLYINGVFQRSTAIPASQTIMANTTPGLVRSPCCSLYMGKLAAFSAYNQALTASEISQNFDALHSRYGI